MQQVYENILNAAKTERRVVIFGESGTGKELVARTIHQLSPRANREFVPVNCGAIPDNLFESILFGHCKGAFTGAHRDKPGLFDGADQGILFLDEVGELSLPLQVKLLRVLDSGEYTPVGSHTAKKVNVRIIAATNRNLLEEVKKGNIREDFFYRLHVIEISLPPLRERKADLLSLVEHFLEHYAETKTQRKLPADIFKQLKDYHWPGNIRELQNVLCRYITTRQLRFASTRDVGSKTSQTSPEVPLTASQRTQKLREALESYEKQYILAVLNRLQWHRGNTAAALDVPIRTLHRKIKKHHLV